jgi:hypothetical protein
MGDCKYCGKPAGFLRSEHPECATAHAEALEKLPQIFTGYIGLAEQPARSNALRIGVEATATEGFLPPAVLKEQVINGLGLAIRTALSDRSLSDSELARIQEIMNQFGLENEDIVASGAHDLLVQGLVLRDLDKGTVQSRFQINGPLLLNLKKDEIVLWMFKNASRSEPKTTVSYAGSSQGVSFRIMKGVSYRVGASKGHRVEMTSVASKGNGDLYVTSKGVYFIGSSGVYSLAHRGITAVEQYSDGIVISPNRGKAQTFLLNDPRFATELILEVGSLQ